jgi:sentrin-specific protease 8
MVFMLMQTPDPLTIKGAFPNFTRTAHIFLPINDTRNASVSKSGSHWSLLVVSVIDLVAFHYDSHPHSTFNRNESRLALDKICTLLRRSMTYMNMDDSPQQENNSDCGVYVCILMRHLLLKKLLSAKVREKVNMSMGGKLVDVSRSRRYMWKTIQGFRRERGRR